MNTMLLAFCYLVLLIIISPLVQKSQKPTNNIRLIEVYEPINEPEEDEVIDTDQYETVADTIIQVFTSYPYEDKREKIVSLLRTLSEIDDTSDFLETHQEVHEFIFSSSA